MKHAVLTLSLLVAAWTAPQAQSAITGRVVADDSGDPVANARVILNFPGRQDRVVAVSERDGRFVLPVPAGRHNIVATKPRFARGQVTSFAGTESVEIRLRRGAAISGRIIDEFGDPVVAAAVFVETGRSAAVVATTRTDDRGEYRIGGLSAGTFSVSVMTVGPAEIRPLGGGRFAMNPVSVKTYYPNATTLAEAQSFEINWGDERAGVDLVLPAARAGLPPFDVGRRGPGLPPAQRLQAARAAAEATRVPPPSAVIRGVVTGRNGVPLPYAVVRLEGMAPQIIRAATDGRFEFGGLPAGTHHVSASKVGHFPREMPVPLKAAETRDDVQLSLDAWGVVGGRVFDEFGDPVQGAKMEVLQLRYEAGRRRLVPAASYGGATDDHGSYRLFGLRPGQYVVSADAGGASAVADLPGYVRTLFPGTALPLEAQFVTIGAAAEQTGFDFGIVRAPTATVSGRFVNTKDEPGGGSLELLPSQRSMSVLGASAGARIHRDGRFEFPNVTPGEYVIQAYRGRTNSWTEGEFGAARVTVTGTDVAGVIVRTSAGSSIRGRIVFEPALGSNVPNPWDVALSPIPVDFDLSPQNNLASANIRPDGSFAIEGINGPRRLEVIKTPPGWTLKQIRSGGFDVTDQVLPFGSADESLRDVEVVLTDRVTELIGSVRDDRARPMPFATIVVFSTDRSQWYPRSRFLQRGQTEADGSFSIAGLPPANYYVAPVRAVPTDGADAWQEPAFLESIIPAAATVLIEDGVRASANFTLSGR
jgi:protocatechuate 3,4-dioxygenase beta subunit